MINSIKIWLRTNKIESIILTLTLYGIFIGINNIYQTNNRKVSAIKQQYVLKKHITFLEVGLKKLHPYESEVNTLENSYAILDGPTALYQDQLILNALSEVADKTSVVLKSIKPLPPTNKNDLIIHPWLVIINGEYYSLVEFLRLLTASKSELFIVIKALHLQVEKNNKEIKSKTLRLEIFFLSYEDPYKKLYTNINKKSPNNVESDYLNLKRNPFALAATNTIQRVSINSWPLNKLRLVGILQNGNKVCGIISDPNANIYKVNIKDKVGLRNEIITNIKPTEIIFSDGRKLYL